MEHILKIIITKCNQNTQLIVTRSCCLKPSELNFNPMELKLRVCMTIYPVNNRYKCRTDGAMPHCPQLSIQTSNQTCPNSCWDMLGNKYSFLFVRYKCLKLYLEKPKEKQFWSYLKDHKQPRDLAKKIGQQCITVKIIRWHIASIPTKNYTHRESLLNNWYHVQSLLITSKEKINVCHHQVWCCPNLY